MLRLTFTMRVKRDATPSGIMQTAMIRVPKVIGWINRYLDWVEGTRPVATQMRVARHDEGIHLVEDGERVPF